ncbi:unnamed protein product [Caretta caretta]
MARLLRIFRKKALQMTPEPEGSNCHLPNGQSNPCVPAGGEAAPVQARWRKCPAFWKRNPAPGAGAKLGEALTRPQRSWPRLRFSRQDPAQEGCRAGWLWGLLCGQQQPQEPSSHSHQEASPCPLTEDLPGPAGQEVEGPCPSTGSSAWDSGSTWASGSSQADGGHCFVPGIPLDSEQEEGVDMAKDEVALKVIREQLQCREKISAEFPRMGHSVAQLALFVSEPDKDISQPAREGTYRLYQLLLQQRGLTIHDAEDLRCYDWHQDSRLLGYKNTARVGEVFGKFFSVGQRRSFLQTAVLAIHDPLLRVSQAGLVLVYSLLGEAQQLMGRR